MQKFTTKEKADFDKKKVAAKAEVLAKHTAAIEKETVRLNAEIEAAKKTRDAKLRKKAQDELRTFQREMEERVQIESRILLKERFPYPVFLYDADKVGISSTGEAEQNELFPNPSQPPGTEGKTCLDLYRTFRQDPKAFLERGA
ncbi:MAG: hypothetical protein FJ245_14270 [Nitrospira sp.]|nr:hypothetical protein [Nitrospira sp.]